MNSLLSPKELAARISCSSKTIYRWLDYGMPYHRAGDKANIYVDWQEFVKWWENR